MAALSLKAEPGARLLGLGGKLAVNDDTCKCGKQPVDANEGSVLVVLLADVLMLAQVIEPSEDGKPGRVEPSSLGEDEDHLRRL